MSRNPPDGLIVLFLGRSRLKESVLANLDSTFDFSDLNDWIPHLGTEFEHIPPVVQTRTHLHDPVVHHLGNVDPTCLSDTRPQVIGDAVSVKVLLKVDRYAFEEDILPNVVRQHPQNRTSLGIR